MKNDPLPAHGRRLAKCIAESLNETVDETFPDLPGNEKVALILFTAQLLFANSFLAASRDRAHALQGVDMSMVYIKENINKFYDMKEKKHEPPPTRQ